MGGGRLSGRRAVVTGAASGLGAAIAARLASEGARVAFADLDLDAAREAAGDGAAFAVDVASWASCEALASAVRQAFGGVDIVVANAGVNHVGDILETDPDEWRRVLDVNLGGVWLTDRAFLPLLIAAGGGAIVNQASVTATAAMRRVAAYSAAKGGVLALTKSIARDFADRNVRANAILPGTVRTPMVERTFAARESGSVDAALAAAAAAYPRGRLGRPEDIAAMAAFLVSDDADWITGAGYAVDGGLTAVVG
ncbi:MAG TPA: SDR family NAD(P)-dependent oxidoreductase [Solirubrobacter sp.]|nr:SDR family NAD(P)-dependent oxidoreductase [Solirubrobacter sp.]